MRTWSKPLLIPAVICALLGLFMLYGYLLGEYPLWSVPGATLIQMNGLGLVLLWGSWLHREKHDIHKVRTGQASHINGSPKVDPLTDPAYLARLTECLDYSLRSTERQHSALVTEGEKIHMEFGASTNPCRTSKEQVGFIPPDAIKDSSLCREIVTNPREMDREWLTQYACRHNWLVSIDPVFQARVRDGASWDDILIPIPLQKN